MNIAHADSAMIDKIQAGADGDGVLQALVPCPAELLNNELTTSYGDQEKQKVVDALRAEMLAKYGYASWYDWCIANWGTKWDLCEVGMDRHDANCATLTFDTAWAPPIEAYEKLLEMGFEIEAFYYEGGMAFAGVWENGVDDCYSEIADSNDAANRLPRELDEMFNISENMAEWEREDEEDLTRWVKDGIAAQEEAAQ